MMKSKQVETKKIRKQEDSGKTTAFYQLSKLKPWGFCWKPSVQPYTLTLAGVARCLWWRVEFDGNMESLDW
jgi:hypothetical protein